MLAQHLILLRGQDLAPLGIGMGDGKGFRLGAAQRSGHEINLGVRD